MTSPSPLARGIILQLQRKRYDELGWLPTDHPGTIADTRSAILPRRSSEKARRISTHIDEVEGIPPTLSPYEDLVSSWHLEEAIRDVDSVSGQLGVRLGAPPLPATLPLGDVHATTVSIPATGEQLLVLDSGLVMYAAVMAGALSRAMPLRHHPDGRPYLALGSGDAREIGERLADVSETRETVARAAITYATDPQPRELLRLLTDTSCGPDDGPTAAALLEGAVGFVVGHEYGHLVQGRSTHGDRDAETTADAHGVTLSTAAMLLAGGHGIEMASAGAEFYFSCLDLVHRTVSMLRYGDEDHLAGPTHPDPATRRTVQRTMTREYPDREAAEASGIFGRIIEHMVGGIWESMRPQVVTLRERDVRASPVWRL